MSFLGTLTAINLIVELFTQITGGVGELIKMLEDLISREEDPVKKAELEFKLAALKEETETA